MNLKDTLFALCSAVGTSGDEHNGSARLACEMLKEYATDASVDHFGNVIGTVGADELKPRLLLDAHIDEIGLIVTYITDDGFLKVAGVGGIDRRLLLAQEVTIYGSELLWGVITSTPPHLSSDDSKVPEIDDIYIDTGLTKAQAEEKISLGDRVVINNPPAELFNNRVTSKAIDDRAGVTAILYALDAVKGKDLPYSVSVVFSSQEETGERGAKTASFKVAPDLAIIVDVSFALTNDDSEVKCGKMAQGAMIGVSPTLNRSMTNELVRIAKEKNIPYQLEVMAGTTGTNADAVGVSGSGVKSATLSIPIRYMHTPVEVCELSDIEAVGQLIAEFLENGGVR